MQRTIETKKIESKFLRVDSDDVEWLTETLNNLYVEASVSRDKMLSKQASLQIALNHGAIPICGPEDIMAREDIAKERSDMQASERAYSYLLDFAKPWFDITVDQHGNHTVTVKNKTTVQATYCI